MLDRRIQKLEPVLVPPARTRAHTHSRARGGRAGGGALVVQRAKKTHWLIEFDENFPSKMTLAGTPIAACELEKVWWAALLTCSLRADLSAGFLPIVAFPSVNLARGPSLEDVLCATCLSRLRVQK